MGIGSSGVVNCANTYLGTANYTVADGYVADRTVIVDGNGPAQLNLNFARGEVLDPRITFSRTSNATRVNAQGLIEYAPHNLLTNSENFDNAVWGKTRSNITANVTTAPDGTLTADKFIDDGVTVGQGYINQNYTYLASTYTFSFYAKAGEVTSVRCYLVDSVGIVSASNAIVDLTTGTVTSGSAIVSNEGSGWYRIAVTGVPTAGSGSVRILQPTDTATANGFYIWGAQLNIGSLQPYYTTSVKNLLGYSQEFSNAAWVKSNSTIDVTPVMGPFGYLGAMKLVENTANAPHYIRQFPSITTPVVFSVYAKAGERTKLQLDCYDATNGTRNAVFNLVSGAVETILGTGVTANITALSNGWYRCCLILPTSATGGDCKIALYTSSNTYTGDGTSGIYIYGAQLSDSASLDPYSYNTGAAPTSSAYYGPRFDYDPVTLASKGLLIEEQRINILLNSDTLSTQLVSVTAQAYTLSFYGTGSVALSGAYTGSLVGTGAYPNRVQLTFTPIIGILTLTVTGSVRYANLEAGAFPTSYIPTTSAQVTRAADNASMVGTNFSSWYNQSEGTIYSEWILGGDNISNSVYSISDGSASNLMRSRYNSAGTGIDNAVITSGVTAAVLNATNQITTYSSYKNAMAYLVNDFARAANTVLITDNSGAIPIVNQINIGASVGAVEHLNGHIKSFKFFSKRFINTYLQSLTQ